MTPFAPIYGYTMADLQNMGLTALLYRTPEPNLNASAPCCSVLSAPSVFKSSAVKVRKPRSKIGRLPKDIQDNLNTMLAAGRPYRDIIRYLNDHGYPGFNKVNLHDWKTSGFPKRLRATNTETPLEGEHTILETVQKPVEGGSNRSAESEHAFRTNPAGG